MGKKAPADVLYPKDQGEEQRDSRVQTPTAAVREKDGYKVTFFNFATEEFEEQHLSQEEWDQLPKKPPLGTPHGR